MRSSLRQVMHWMAIRFSQRKTHALLPNNARLAPTLFLTARLWRLALLHVVATIFVVFWLFERQFIDD
jgi:hypothetical protein